jgi:signal transduction histidine kinase
MGRTLSSRLLLLTVATVMLIEVAIFVPSVARFRVDYLEERLRMAELVSLALLATPEAMLDTEMEARLLDRAGARGIVLRRGGARALLLSAPSDRPVTATYDLEQTTVAERLAEALVALVRREARLIRVVGQPYDAAAGDIEVIIEERPLIAEMRAYGWRIFLLSLIISVGTAALIWLLVRRLLVQPMAALTRNMAAFREDPEDVARVIRPGSGVSELRAAEEALAETQMQVREALRERARLAALGEAVARIAHDLRNILSTTQLLADRLEGSADHTVRLVGPKLIGSLDRAIALCQSTLRFGRAEEAHPVPRRIVLRALVQEVGESVLPEGPVVFDNAVPDGLIAEADPDQLFRILANLVRNAGQAIEAGRGAGSVSVAAHISGAGVAIDVSDDGPGLPMTALENLFKPFRAGARKGGSGLGLAIAHDLTALQGGRLSLIASTTEGTVFRIMLPKGGHQTAERGVRSAIR